MKAIRLILTVTLLYVMCVSTGHAQSVLESGLDKYSPNSNISYREFVNDLIAKERYIDYALVDLKKAADLRGQESFRRFYAEYTNRNGAFAEIRADQFGYKGGAEGDYFNFTNKEDYDRFKEYLRFYNIRGSLNAYRQSIIEGATPEQRTDYFRRELLSATKSYEIGDYLTSRFQFEDIYKNYSRYFSNLDDVLLLQGESSFGARYYAEAREAYEKILKNHPNSKSTSAAVYKILFMDYVYDQAPQFRRDYSRYLNRATEKDENLYKSYLIAATVEYQNKEYARAIELLGEVPETVKFRRIADYATGTFYVAMDSIDLAEKSFKRVADATVWPWDTKQDNYIKNSALVQTGHIYYMRGNRIMTEARRIFAEGETKKAIEMRQTAIVAYETAERYYGGVSKGYEERELADLGRAWAKFKERNYNEAQIEIDDFLRRNRTSNNLYQALFLSGYITQKKNPTDPEFALRDYYFVYNGMAANEFLDKFYSQKRLFRDQKLKVETAVLYPASPEEAAAAAELRDLQNQTLSSLAFDKKTIAITERSLISDDRRAELLAKQQQLVAQRETLTGKGLTNLARYADKSQLALGEMLKLVVDPISDEVRLFAEHAPVIFAGEVSDYAQAIEEYKRAVQVEFNEAQKQVKSGESLEPTTDARQQLLASYYRNNASLFRNQSNAILTLLYERNFYDNKTVERAGSMAQYAFSGLVYSEISNRRAQVENYKRIVDIFKRATKKKTEQMQFYLAELEKTMSMSGGKVLTKADVLQKEFDDIYNDFRKAFFIGVDTPKQVSQQQQGTALP